MKVTQTYTYLGDFVFEQVTTIDGDNISFTTNVLPNSKDTSTGQSMEREDAGSSSEPGGPISQPLGVQLPLPPPSLLAEEPPKEKSKRGLKAFIRGAWTFIFTVFGEGLSYLTQNVTGLDLPPGVGAAIGASAAGLSYGIKKYVAPDTLL